MLAFASEHMNVGGSPGPRSQHFQRLGLHINKWFSRDVVSAYNEKLKVLPTKKKAP